MKYSNTLKSRLAYLLISVAMLGTNAFAGDRDRAGGNEYGIMVYSLSKEVARDLLHLEKEGVFSGISGFNGIELSNSWLNQRKISILMTDQTLYSDQYTKKHVVTAVSFPQKRVMVINELRFKKISTHEQRKALMFHEMLVIEGKEKTGDYHISSPYFDAIITSSTSKVDWKTVEQGADQAITNALKRMENKSESFDLISTTLSSGKASELYSKAKENLNSQFDDRCGDTFCEGDYSYQSLDFDCSYNTKTKQVKECVWSFAGSFAETSNTGSIQQKSRIFTCKLPIKNQNVEQTLTFFSQADISGKSGVLPGSTLDIWDILIKCLE